MGAISLKYKSKNGNLTAPQDIDLGAMIPIATVTIGSGGAAYAEFTSIPQNYEHLQIRGIGRSTATGTGTETFYVRLNSDTNGNYSSHAIYGNGSSISAGYGLSTSFIPFYEMPRSGELSNTFGTFIMDILDYANTNKYKTSRTLSGMDTNATNYQYISLFSGNWRSTSAVNTIRIFPSGGNFTQYSSFALYGIKRAGA